MALGGTDQIGASSYYLEIAGHRFLFDFGRGISGKKTYAPDYDSLLRSGCLYSLSQLDAILLSHGHFDHIGALPLLSDICPDTPVYATTLTRELGAWLLWDKCTFDGDALKRFHNNLLSEAATRKIHTVSYRKPFSVGGVRITFYEAGHVPGAAMIYIESAECNLLYTGDFMEGETQLTSGYCLPDHLNPDVMILCGTHSKHPQHIPRNNLRDLLPDINERLNLGLSVYISTNQLTKGVETVCFLNQRLPDIPLFLSDPIWSLAEQLSRLGVSTLSQSCYRESSDAGAWGIHLGGKKKEGGCLEANFSLHAGFNECVTLLRKFQPATVFVVHAPRDRYMRDDGALQKALPDIDVLFPIQGHLYANTTI